EAVFFDVQSIEIFEDLQAVGFRGGSRAGGALGPLSPSRARQYGTAHHEQEQAILDDGGPQSHFASIILVQLAFASINILDAWTSLDALDASKLAKSIRQTYPATSGRVAPIDNRLYRRLRVVDGVQDALSLHNEVTFTPDGGTGQFYCVDVLALSR